MKKIVITILTVALVLCGCNADGDNSSSELDGDSLSPVVESLDNSQPDSGSSSSSVDAEDIWGEAVYVNHSYVRNDKYEVILDELSFIVRERGNPESYTIDLIEVIKPESEEKLLEDFIPYTFLQIMSGDAGILRFSFHNGKESLGFFFYDLENNKQIVEIPGIEITTKQLSGRVKISMPIDHVSIAEFLAYSPQYREVPEGAKFDGNGLVGQYFDESYNFDTGAAALSPNAKYFATYDNEKDIVHIFMVSYNEDMTICTGMEFVRSQQLEQRDNMIIGLQMDVSDTDGSVTLHSLPTEEVPDF